MPALRARVVGAGVVGLTTALCLAEDGWQVEVVTAEPPSATTSSVSAAFWYPYLAGPAQAVERWGRATADRLATLAADVSVPVQARTVHEQARAGSGDPGWRTSMPDLQIEDEVPEGIVGAWTWTSWVADMSRYLPWLVERCQGLGVEIGFGRMSTLAGAWASGTDLVVNCAGVEAHHLAEDPRVEPVAGQVVVVRAPWIEDVWLDTDTPGGATYVVPRADAVVCGGTAGRGQWSRKPDDAVTEDILGRCLDLVPELAGFEVLDVRVGLRPARPDVRLEMEQTPNGPVLHHYGHGGAGLTLSWGCAADAVDLARPLIR